MGKVRTSIGVVFYVIRGSAFLDGYTITFCGPWWDDVVLLEVSHEL